MNELKERLIRISDSYYDFVCGIMLYAERKPEHLALLNAFLDDHPDATSSDVVYFVSTQSDFFEDSVPMKESIA